MKTLPVLFTKTIFIVFCFLFNASFSFAQLQSGQKLIVPEFSNGFVKLYEQRSTGLTENRLYRLDLSTLAGCNQPKPNGVIMHKNDLYVLIDGPACQRIYRFPSYLLNPTTSKANVQLITSAGSGYVGIAFDSNDNLYTTEGSFGNNFLVRYNAPNYTSSLNLGNASAVSYLANLAFDNTGSLWVSDYKNNRIVVFKGPNISANNFHVLSNLTGTIPVATSQINDPSSRLFTQPEGLAFDAIGNLWVANNNDGSTGVNLRTSLVKITPDLQNSILATPNGGTLATNIGQANSANGFSVYNVPNLAGRSQLGGLQIDETNNRLFVNEQIGGKGLWFDIVNIANITPTYANHQLNITSTNPGNGGIYLAQLSDLYIKDTNADTGIEPNPSTEYMYQSNDIWVRNTNDGVQSHQNAQYVAAGKTNYVYVRVKNRGSVASSGTEKITLYWANASMGLAWQNPWTPANPSGSPIATQIIPVVSPNAETIIEIPWANVPQPLNGNHHFCLLARITTDGAINEGMSLQETPDLYKNVQDNNNIAWKNISIFEFTPMIGGTPFGVIIANHTGQAMKAKVGFRLLDAKGKEMPLGNTSLLIKASGKSLEKLNRTEFNREIIRPQKDGSFQVLDLEKGIENIVLSPNEVIPLTIEVKPEGVTEGFALQAVQYAEDSTGVYRIVGGQTLIAGKVVGFNTDPTKPTGFDIPWWLWILLFLILCWMLWRILVKK